jgi:phosphoglycerol transferase MdoB-like AlkP superfamily enzyme
MHQAGTCSSTDTGNLGERREFASRLWRRGAAILFVLLAAAVPFLCIDQLKTAMQWSEVFGLAALALMCYLPLRPEVLATWNRLKASRLLKYHWNAFLFCLTTTGVVFGIETANIIHYGSFPALPHPLAVLINSLLVISFAGFVFALTNRFAFAIATTYFVYAFAFTANFIKVQYLQTPIKPLDVHYLPAFSNYASLFLGKAFIVVAIAVAAVGLAVAGALWWKSRYRIRPIARMMLAVVSVAIFVAIMCSHRSSGMQSALMTMKLEKNPSNAILVAERRGVLWEFVSDIPETIVYPPADYTRQNVARIVDEYSPAKSAKTPDVNIIVFLVESLMDTDDLHLRFTRDPLPNLHAAMRNHTSGHLIVPYQFYGSTNTEFEVLTGISSTSLPLGACPYMQYMHRDIPTVPGFLHKQGYATFTAHAGPPYLYDRARVYKFMNVGEEIWLTERIKEKHGVKDDRQTIYPMDVDVSGRNPTDDFLVGAVIDASKKHPRYFMYASANATHSPYDYDGFQASTLDVSESLSEPAKKELKTYINAVHVSDLALKKLFDHFEKSADKTIIVVLGDHRPPFEHSSEIYAASGCLNVPTSETLPESRKIPLLIWTNFEKKGPDITRSANFLATEIFAHAGIRPSGFLGLNDAVRRQIDVLSPQCLETRDGTFVPPATLSPSASKLLNDYRVLEYDLLPGKQYALKDLLY